MMVAMIAAKQYAARTQLGRRRQFASFVRGESGNLQDSVFSVSGSYLTHKKRGIPLPAVTLSGEGPILTISAIAIVLASRRGCL